MLQKKVEGKSMQSVSTETLVCREWSAHTCGSYHCYDLVSRPMSVMDSGYLRGWGQVWGLIAPDSHTWRGWPVPDLVLWSQVKILTPSLSS